MKYLHNNLRDVGRRHLFYFWSELIVALSLVAGLASLSVSFIPTFTTKAEIAEVLTSFTTLKTTISQNYMEVGHWPKKGSLNNARYDAEGVIDRIEFDGKGTINYFLNDSVKDLSGKIISFSATISDSEEWENLIWVCGYTKPSKGYRIQGENLTNVAPQLLPSVCRT